MEKKVYLNIENIFKDFNIFINKNSNNSTLKGITNELGKINEKCEERVDNVLLFDIAENALKISKLMIGMSSNFSIDIMCASHCYNTGGIIQQGHYINIEDVVLDIYNKNERRMYFKVFIPVNKYNSFEIRNCDDKNKSDTDAVIGQILNSIDKL